MKQMSIKHLAITLLSILLIGILQNTAYARSEAEVARDLTKAIDSVVVAYKKTGVSGLTAKTQECYEKNAVESPFYCIYIDIASRRIDQIAVEAMHFPPSDFFADEPFSSRIIPIFVSNNMDMNTSNQYLESITILINNLLEKKLLRQK